jgi:hypothetical protein
MNFLREYCFIFTTLNHNILKAFIAHIEAHMHTFFINDGLKDEKGR